MKLFLTIFIVLLMAGCGSSNQRRMMNQMETLVKPAVSEYKRCDAIEIKPQKSKCTLPLVKAFLSIDDDNPIKTLLVNFGIEMHELAINFDRNLIDDQMYELGKMRAKNNFDQKGDNLKARERAIHNQNQNSSLFCRQVGTNMYCD